MMDHTLPDRCAYCGDWEDLTATPIPGVGGGPFPFPGFCSTGCREAFAEEAGQRRSWSPETAKAAAAGVARTVEDLTRCSECGRSLPPRGPGKRGRPRKTCSDHVWPPTESSPKGQTCAQRREARLEVARQAHANARDRYDPRIAPASSGVVYRGSLDVPLRDDDDVEARDEDAYGEPDYDSGAGPRERVDALRRQLSAASDATSVALAAMLADVLAETRRTGGPLTRNRRDLPRWESVLRTYTARFGDTVRSGIDPR
jgi:hypothetical protein